MSVETKPNKLIKGLVLDTFHTDVDNTVATYALNAQLEDQEGNHFHYGSEVGTTYIKNIPDTHVVIGHINMERNETVLFTTDGTNSTIGILSRNDDMSYQYEIKVDDTKQTKKLGFSKQGYIRGVYRLLNGCDKVIYFVDGINKDRRLNINQLDSYKITDPQSVASGIVFDDSLRATIITISSLTGDIKLIRLVSANTQATSNLLANLNIIKLLQSSISSTSNLSANATKVIPINSSLTANSILNALLTKVIDVNSNLSTQTILSADALITRLFAASLNGNGSIFANPLITKLAESLMNANGTVNASALVSKLAASSLTGAGTLVAELTVGGANITVDYLVVAGGGGGGVAGGLGGAAGGGGCGGARCTIDQTGGGGVVETSISLLKGTNYSIIIGAGGGGGIYSPVNSEGYNGNNGNNSVFQNITSIGGGGGGGKIDKNGIIPSGGGVWSSGVGAIGTLNQSFAGGNGGSTGRAGGGGGGAGQIGLNGVNSPLAGGNGGSGITTNITNTNITYAGGGGGSSQGGVKGLGGTGGGGNGGNLLNTKTSTNGLVNTGGGGGGDTRIPLGQQAGSGGSGIIVIKIPDTITATFSAGVTETNTTSGGFKIYTITAAGALDTVTFS